MKGLVFKGPRDLVVADRPVRSPATGEVLVKTKAASLCFSDIRVYKGQKYALPDVILGHEMAGEIAEIGDGVTTVKKGDAVTICPIIACGACYFCSRGKRNRCLNRNTLGYDMDGGMAEYVLIPEELVSLGHVLKLPQGLSWDVACQVEPFACALYSLIECGIGPGTSLALIGAGPMGLTHLLIARAMGCGTIVVADPVESRLEMAMKLGATIVIQPEQLDVKKATIEITEGLGVDAAIATVGNVDAIGTAVDVVRKQGIVNIFGGCPPGSEVVLDPNRIHYDELWITGTQNANPEHYQRALNLLSVMPEADSLITNRFPIDNAPDAFTAREGFDGLKAILDFN